MIRTIYVLIVYLTYDIVAGFRATFCAPVFQGSFHAFHWFNNSAPGRTYGVLPDGTMRLAGKQENGTADARRCTQMDPNPAWPSRRISKQAFLASLAEAMVPVPSACISVHLRFQFLAFPPAAPGCRGGRSSPRTKPHAPVPAPARPSPLCGRAQAAPASQGDAKTPCTCTDHRQRIAPVATLLSRSEPAEQNPMHQFGTVRRGRRLGRRVARRRQGPMHLFGRPSHLPGLAAWRQNPMHQKQSPARRCPPSRMERT